MKRLIYLFIIALSANGIYAQLPETPEDISPLLIGEVMPQRIMSKMKAKDGTLSALIQRQPSVVIFYRGSWCPYCSRHLAEIGEAEAIIKKLGYQVIAISPDSEVNLRKAAKENKLGYTLFSDSSGELARAMGIAFKAPEKYQPIIQEGSGGINTEFLPVPSVFVTNKKGVIQFEHIAPDYKERLSAKLLIAVLTALKS